MTRIERKRHRPIFRTLVAAQALAPLLIMAAFVWLFHGRTRTVLYHALIVYAGYLAIFAGLAPFGFLRAVRRRRIAGYALPLAWGCFTVWLYFIYLLAWGGRLGLGMNLTFGLVLPYVLHPGLVVRTFLIPLPLFWSILVLFPAALLGAYIAAGPAVASSLLRAGARLRRHARRPVSPASGARIATGALGPILLAGGLCWLWPPPTLHHLLGDPVFDSLREENTQLPITELGAGSDALRAAYVAPDSFARKNVILIIVDALRADHLGVLGYARDTTPFLDSLQATGHLHAVRSFYSASCCTLAGVLTLLRSQHWFHMTRRAFALQDVLKKAGYRVHFILGGDHTNFQGLKFYYGSSLDTFSDGLSPARHYSLNDDRGVLETFDQTTASDGTPAFFYFHLMSAHNLAIRWPENVRYQPASVAHDPTQYTNNYDNGIIQADAVIRQLFSALARKGYLQNSLVIITGDHGESLGEHGVYSHSLNLHAEEITPPLLLYDPDPVTYHNLDLAGQVDVAPTILDRLGLPIPPSWDGRSLLRGEPARFSYLRIGDFYGVIDHTAARTLKYIYDGRLKREHLFDVARDPHDDHDIFAAADPAEVADLRTAIGAFLVHPGA